MPESTPKSGDFHFQKNIVRALENRQLGKNLRAAMDTLVEKRKAVFPDRDEFEQLRTVAGAVKDQCLARLPELLIRLEEKCTQNGIIVHWAEKPDDANHIILDILNAHNITRVVKGKSMVSEELHVNHFLENHGIESMETDLGEFIIQLDNETPSHIVVPAIHKNRDQVARLFHEKIPGAPYTEDVEALNAIARKTLRQKFFEAQAGLSGVNFAVAETGTLALVENEGNGRMCTTVPPVHIAVTGIEKVVERLSDVPPLLQLLTGSATGQRVTTYVNMITSPRKKGEKDGPEEVHLILLDNGRSRILADPELRQTLKCIRCGTCLNHCPVYTRIGGHAYGFVYPGPIGKILTPQMAGLEKAGELATASTLCRACSDVCPVKIPIPDLLRRLREESRGLHSNSTAKGHGYRKNIAETLAWKGWKLLNTTPAINRIGHKFMAASAPVLPNIDPISAWTGCRTKPQFAKKSLHEMVQKAGIPDE